MPLDFARTFEAGMKGHLLFAVTALRNKCETMNFPSPLWNQSFCEFVSGSRY